ncbi:multidrug transporter subunit MdtN [Neoroseomonas lacus]|uniref:Multidrug resistance protein MdtN n=1 Tax=Neoroseomonas lacus TaxID=287609 RepID=A0A917NKM0_9PROT|nr:multidrug transporter subunit MdtN [Neoroseomonas lacus]GGJ04922.1 multidrug resistance protein MdtN [Neoroseomonas lacus]
MRAVGLQRRNLVGTLLALLLVGAAVGVGIYVDRRVTAFPSSDDASIDADIVQVAATVGGRVIEIPIRDNQLVARGDLLFRIDPEPYQLAVDRAEAALAISRAALDTRRRVVSTETTDASIAQEQVTRAQTNRDLAARTVERLGPLATHGYVPAQQLDQAQVALRDADTALTQAREHEAASRTAIGTLEGATAGVQAAQAMLATAQRDLRHTQVHATVPGRVTGLTKTVGEILAPSQPLFTLVSTAEWFAVANVREVDLRRLTVGDCATVFSMIDRRHPIAGRVESIGWGVQTDDRINLPRALPVVARTMDWVRVAQRFPVRIRLEAPPEQLVRLGATASIEIRHGPACR